MNPLLANVHRKRRHTEVYTSQPTQQTTQHQHQQHHPPTRKYVPRQSSCSIPMQSSPFASSRRNTSETSPYSPSNTGSCCRACRLGNPCPQQKLLSIASPTRILSSPNSPCPSSPYSPCPNPNPNPTPDDDVVFKRIKLTPLTIPSRRTSTSSSPEKLTTTSTTESSLSHTIPTQNEPTQFQVPAHFPQYNNNNTNSNTTEAAAAAAAAATDLEASNALLLQLHQQLIEYTRHYQHLVNLCAQSLQQQQQSQYQPQTTQPYTSQPLTGTADPTINTLSHHLTMQQQQLLQMVPTSEQPMCNNPYTNSSQFSSSAYVQPSTGSNPTFNPLYLESFTTTKEMSMNAFPESYSHSYSQSSTSATLTATPPILMPIPVSSIARTMATPSQSSSRSISSDTTCTSSYSSPWSSRAASPSPSPSPPSPHRKIQSTVSLFQSAAPSSIATTEPANQS